MWTYSQGNPREMPALVLAYVGDAVYELYVRTYLVNKGIVKMKKLHEAASSLVNAASQAGFMHKIESILTEEEVGVARRGRNTKTSHVPKNAEVVDYRLSTGFEALIGYLFLMQREDRIKEILDFLFCECEE